MNKSFDILTGRLDFITQAEAHTGPVDFPAIAEARQAIERIKELDQMASQLVNVNPADVIQTTANRLIAGKLDINELLLASTQIQTGSTDQARSIIDQAREQIASHALANLNRIREQWVPIMRPAIDKTLTPLARMRRRLPEGPEYDRHLPADVASNLRMVTRNHLALFDLTAKLVAPGADKDNTTLSIWLHPDRYTGPSFPHGAELSGLGAYYRAGATPGVWTRSEVSQARRAERTNIDDGPLPAA